MLSANDLIHVEAELGKRSLRDFVETGWSQVEARPYTDNWHIHAVSDHLQAVSDGEIRRIIINIPPRHTKSLVTNVFWPSWDWLHNSWRDFLFASYRQGLSGRDNRRARQLVDSEWYKQRFAPRIDPQNNTTARWGIQNGGQRLITSVGGSSSTGEGGDVISVDDPISADQARHPKQRQNVIDWWQDTIKSRFNDATIGVFVVIMQRLHEDDLTGHILAHETGWDHLCLPARYEPDHIYPVRSSIGFKDPRTKPGELLNPKRFGEQELNDIAKPGSYQEAGQLQQRPAPREGGMFPRSMIGIVKTIPHGSRVARGWDLAASEEKDSAYTAGVGLAETPDKEYIIFDVTRDQQEALGVKRMLKATATRDDAQFRHKVRGSLPQDPGAGGKVWAKDLIKHLAGHNYSKSTESGDKIARAEPVAAQAQAGNLYLLEGSWNKAFLDEAEMFPNGKFKDQIDALSRAFNELTQGSIFNFYVSGEDEQ